MWLFVLSLRAELQQCVLSQHQRIKIGKICVFTKTNNLILDCLLRSRHFKVVHVRLFIEAEMCKLQLFLFHQNPKMQDGTMFSTFGESLSVVVVTGKGCPQHGKADGDD